MATELKPDASNVDNENKSSEADNNNSNTKNDTNGTAPNDATNNAFLGQPIDRKGKTLSDEQLAVFNRYNYWKSNLVYLYNHIECYALPYPARTVQFLPNPRHIISSKNQYKRYSNCPFVYPSHCTVPKQERASSQTPPQMMNNTTNNNNNVKRSHTTAAAAPSSSSSSATATSSSVPDGSASSTLPNTDPCTLLNNNNNPNVKATKMTPIYYLQSMNYFIPNRIEEQEALWNLFHHSNIGNEIDFSNINGIRESALMTGILPYDSYMHGGPCVESAYDVYRLRVMPQQPHLLATRSYHEDIAIYWLNYDYLATPLSAFDRIRKRTANNTIPERSGLTHSDDEDSDDEDEQDDDVEMKASHNKHKRKRQDDSDSDQVPTKRQKLRYKHANYLYADDSDDSDEDNNCMDIEVGTGAGYLIAVGQTSMKCKTGWGLAFNPQHAGMFVTGNSDGSIACWDLNMVDNAHCMNKMGKFKNKKNSADPTHYMRDSKIRNRTFNDGPPFISNDRCDEYHWFEEFEKYGNWGSPHIMNQQYTNPDVLDLDWCSDSSQIFVSCSGNGQISIWDRRSRAVKKKPVLWTWGTSHNQSILSVSWNPIQHSLIASGDKANKVRIWDVRSFNRHVIQLNQHESCVYHVKWCPYNKYLLASSGADKMLLMYDLRRSGLSNPNKHAMNETNPAEIPPKAASSSSNQDGDSHKHENIDSITKLMESLSSNDVNNFYDASCPELVFAHCGHTACIPEFDWCPSGDLTMISTDMDGIIHTWQPPQAMLNTFAWVLHSQQMNYALHETRTDTVTVSNDSNANAADSQ